MSSNNQIQIQYKTILLSLWHETWENVSWIIFLIIFIPKTWSCWFTATCNNIPWLHTLNLQLQIYQIKDKIRGVTWLLILVWKLNLTEFKTTSFVKACYYFTLHFRHLILSKSKSILLNFDSNKMCKKLLNINVRVGGSPLTCSPARLNKHSH